MFHGVIQKITLAQLFLRHGVLAELPCAHLPVLCMLYKVRLITVLLLEWSYYSEAWSRSRNLCHQQADSKQTNLVLFTIQVQLCCVLQELPNSIGLMIIIIVQQYSAIASATVEQEHVTA